MTTIWKYEIAVTDYLTVMMPAGAEILHVEVQHDAPCLWVLVETNGELVPRAFRIFGTGHRIDVPVRKHVASFLMHAGSLVWHLFEVPA